MIKHKIWLVKNVNKLGLSLILGITDSDCPMPGTLYLKIAPFTPFRTRLRMFCMPYTSFLHAGCVIISAIGNYLYKD